MNQASSQTFSLPECILIPCCAIKRVIVVTFVSRYLITQIFLLVSPGYRIVRRDRPAPSDVCRRAVPNRGGGGSVLYRDTIKVTALPVVGSGPSETFWVREHLAYREHFLHAMSSDKHLDNFLGDIFG